MNITQTLYTLLELYNLDDREERPTTTYCFREKGEDDIDLSPPLVLPPGGGFNQVPSLYKRICEKGGVDGLIVIEDAWTYPEPMLRELFDLMQAEGYEALQQKIKELGRPRDRDDKVTRAFAIAMNKQGRIWIGTVERGGEVLTGPGDDLHENAGERSLHIKNMKYALGIGELP